VLDPVEDKPHRGLNRRGLVGTKGVRAYTFASGAGLTKGVQADFATADEARGSVG